MTVRAFNVTRVHYRFPDNRANNGRLSQPSKIAVFQFQAAVLQCAAHDIQQLLAFKRHREVIVSAFAKSV
jgi:hypothetical protein